MHLAVRVSLAEGPRRPLAADLYRVALDPGFRTAQYGQLGVHQTLADLRTTLDVALGLPASRDLLAAVRTIAARRAMQEVESLSRAVFDRIDQEDFRGALQKAEHYTEGRSAGSNWDQLLPIYVA